MELSIKNLLNILEQPFIFSLKVLFMRIFSHIMIFLGRIYLSEGIFEECITQIRVFFI